MFGSSNMFGGGGGGFGAADADSGHLPVAGGGYGGAGAGGFGLAGAGSDGPGGSLGGFLSSGYGDDGPERGGGMGPASGQGQGAGVGGQRQQATTLTPVTIRMLLDAVKQSGGQQQGPDANYIVNNRELGMLTLVACVDSVVKQPMYKEYTLNDCTGRFPTHWYTDSDGVGIDQEIRPGDYVRIFGHVRAWQGVFGVNAHKVLKVEKADEIAYHFAEVANVHLTQTGKLVKPAPQAAPAAAPIPAAAPSAGGPFGSSGMQAGAAGGGFSGGGGGGQQQRPGDWNCPNCGINVWGSKDSCFKCGARKSDQQPPQSQYGLGGGESGGFRPQQQPQQPPPRYGAAGGTPGGYQPQQQQQQQQRYGAAGGTPGGYQPQQQQQQQPPPQHQFGPGDVAPGGFQQPPLQQQQQHFSGNGVSSNYGLPGGNSTGPALFGQPPNNAGQFSGAGGAHGAPSTGGPYGPASGGHGGAPMGGPYGGAGPPQQTGAPAAGNPYGAPAGGAGFGGTGGPGGQPFY